MNADSRSVPGPNPATSEPLRNIDLSQFLGQHVDDARAVIESLGGTLRAIRPGEGKCQDLHPNRITVFCEKDTIMRIDGFG